MPVITGAEAYLVDLEVETVRTDALQTFIKQETIFVRVTTDDGGEGVGYSYTIGTGGTAVLALLRDNLLDRLPGQDPRRIEAIWRDLFLTTKATTVGAITSLALAAIDTALWDWRCRAAGQPLWLLAGGAKDRIPLYDTEGGWLHLDTEELVAGARASRAAGWPGIKMKVGRTPAQDAERLAAVRDAVGPDFDVMLDANQSLTAADAIRRARLLERYDPYWFEEPLPAEDVAGHEQLSRATSIPVAVGESMYAPGQFAEYIRRGAAGVIQVDVARIGGITPWLKVAHLAEAANVPVCPHFLMELHVSLCCAVPNSRYLEHIPQLRAITRSEITIVDGQALAPATPGLGIDWDHDAIDDRRIA
ncbi:L-alanine-DL-glutamate epimerase-like enolase superfamily enzyme [Actinoplanes lutulentus]|uniref:L-alanine-DL-glutamate epimerase-like enolase superfamily enzyme n=1 Tax=Actinoplanes lutulentus TaxID=1287878 RepID=A0A327YYV9_9ACTN|nr:mandelate racemase/muconate lactonizing enzyme family protein [Actinoplanes lutulentus]MBB2948757.1 L-alanine-DL-glutamate epimerase-like enolase superfamily enzyme [Actinoplanes lutulentus]RAK26173.1 L-alanine-DL-glutamate epimerase-like enolase superfamily enzyme [Actinoplanes lutulentus]